MKIEKIRKAVKRARRFAKEGEALILEIKAPQGESLLYGSKQSGSLRRRSLDLTRSLAEMRKP